MTWLGAGVVMTWLGLAALVVAIAAAVLVKRRMARQSRARGVAEELLPEIRSVMAAADPTSESDGEPGSIAHYRACHQRLPRVLSGEQYFAVETFYQCVESYRAARATMLEAFSEKDERSLGDRIRAKDLRDRCLKDVYYAGHGAVEKLEQLLA